MSDKRRYDNTLDFVAAGFRVCWRNANDLVEASKVLHANKLHAPALSLAVLALEEIGKLCAIDGLLFTGTKSSKSQIFSKALRDHNTKLSALFVLPMLISNLARIDPRHEKDQQRYEKAIAISFTQLKSDGNDVIRLTGNEDFSVLNQYKQQGFYTSVDKGAFVAPRDAVTPALADAVHHFAWRAVSTLDFVLKDGNLERYIHQAKALRSKLSEADHRSFEEAAQKLYDSLFN